jgi:hypothetical protein
MSKTISKETVTSKITYIRDKEHPEIILREIIEQEIIVTTETTGDASGASYSYNGKE